MKFKEIILKENSREALDTEFMFEIAAARADEISLIKFIYDFSKQHDIMTAQRLASSIIRRAKSLKRDGKIQFFATKKSFSSMTTEAIFLINKYPSFIEDNVAEEPYEFIYIKL